MRNNLKVILMLTVLLFGFQNCSDVKFAEVDPQVSKLEAPGDGASIEEEEPDLDRFIPGGEEGSEPPAGDVVNEEDAPYVPPYNPGTADPNYDLKDPEKVSDKNEEDQEREAMELYARCFRHPNFVDKVAKDSMGGDLDIKNEFFKIMAHKNINKLNLKNVKRSIAVYKDVVEVESAKNLSGIIKISATRANDIQNMKGYLCVSADEMSGLDNLHGITVLKGNSENGGRVSDLTNIRGPLILKDLSVGKIDNMRGLLILINSEVMELKNFKGLVREIEL